MIANLSLFYLLLDLSDMFDASLCIAVMHHLASTGKSAFITTILLSSSLHNTISYLTAIMCFFFLLLKWHDLLYRTSSGGDPGVA